MTNHPLNKKKDKLDVIDVLSPNHPSIWIEIKLGIEFGAQKH